MFERGEGGRIVLGVKMLRSALEWVVLQDGQFPYGYCSEKWKYGSENAAEE